MTPLLIAFSYIEERLGIRIKVSGLFQKNNCRINIL